MTHAIETTGLARTFGRLEAVRGIDLRVPRGSIFALIGPNGAGKTTTIKLLMNLVRPTRGAARVLDTDSRHLGVSDFQRIGYVSENQRLPDWMSTDGLLDYCRPLYPTWSETLCAKLRADLDLRSPAPLRRLSRGTRMKAALLASLAFQPQLVILDEPFTGLDPLVREELIRALLEAPGDGSRTVFVSSHDVEEVERLADWVAFMADGRIVFAEPVSSLLERFRLVEVMFDSGEAADLPPVPGWMAHGRAGRMLQFIDSAHDRTDAEARIAAAFPGCTIQTRRLPLREIFVALARHRRQSENQ